VRCIRPIDAGFDRQGDIVYSQRKMDPGQVPFQFPCRKCLPCRLNIGREKAIRCWHESQFHEDSIFLTLTYDDDHVGDGRLNYLDFQLFMKSLREKVTRNITDKELRDKLYISYMVTGEYGEKNKRQHWHAIIFNYRPYDSKYHYTTDRGEEVYTSEALRALWKRGNIEYGSVTIDSASYVARYAAKKLVHGKDKDHRFHPVHKQSSWRAIGKTWIETYWKQTFRDGYIILPNRSKAGIPRYYQDWFRKNHFEQYLCYIQTVRQKTIELAGANEENEWNEYLKQCAEPSSRAPLTRPKIKETILKSKFKQLQERLKL